MLRGNSSDALARLYDRYSPFVFTLARLMQPTGAEEITETVFLELWRRRDHLRSASPLADTLIDLTLDCASNWDGGMGPAWLQRSSSAATTLAPFSHLTAPARQVLLLAIVGGLGTREIAAALDISSAAVTKILTAGMEQVREAGRAP